MRNNINDDLVSVIMPAYNAEEFIGYMGFEKVKEPTVICMFGDHQPSIETDFIAEVLGVNNLSNLTVEQEQSRHATPFFIFLKLLGLT